MGLVLPLLSLITLEASLLLAVRPTLTLAILSTVAGPRVILGRLLSTAGDLLLLTRCLTLRSRVGDRSGYAIWRVIDIQFLVNCLWDGLNLSTKFLLDHVEVVAVFPVDQVNRQTQMPKSARTTDPVEIRFCVFREIKVDDDVNGLDINTARK